MSNNGKQQQHDDNDDNDNYNDNKRKLFVRTSPEHAQLMLVKYFSKIHISSFGTTNNKQQIAI